MLKEEAIIAFNKQSRHKCSIFYQFIDEACLLDNAKTLKLTYPPYAQCHSGVYIMDLNPKWSFAMTH
jgi:hypothetical protein